MTPIFVLGIIATGFLILGAYIATKIQDPSQISDKINNLDITYFNTRLFRVLSTLYFVLLAWSILVYYYRSDPYSRPILFFASTILMAIVVVGEIICSDIRSPLRVYLILFQVIMVTVILTMTQNFLYPTVLGFDPWSHKNLVENILWSGRIPKHYGYESYNLYPIMHLIIATMYILLKLNYKIASFLSIGVVTLIIEATIIYLISSKMYSTKIGLLSALFVALSDNVLDMIGKSIVPNTLALSFVMICLLLLYQSLPNGFNHKRAFLFVFLTIILLITHTIGYAFLIFTVIAFYSVILGLRYTPQREHQALGLILLIVTAGIFYWFLISKIHGYKLIGILKIAISDLFIGTKLYSSNLSKSGLPWFYPILRRMGLIVYTSMASIGMLFVLLKDKRVQSFSFLVIAGGMTVMGLSSFTLPSLAPIAHRFWYYMEILDSVFISLAIFLIAIILTKSRTLQITSITIIILVLISLGVFSPTWNIDNPFLKHYWPRDSFTYSEFSSIEFINNFVPENIKIAADRYYSLHIGNPSWPDYFNRSLLGKHDQIIVFRLELKNRAVWMGKDVFPQRIVLPNEQDLTKSQLYVSNCNIIYSSKSITMSFC
ncbi:hypothetical protein [Pyrococcus yayanosii]|uniref:Glycosyltransferase RgtA/B/C/D-like domain-containing protein n=1 Tax=Pyrococcus yayanosii (strain CH1 / JCM 16557) TaxID=529709 RepID=F8AHY7_PYRYC|nr:hypothetical protein [Pyrococcus yayanosii]AEH25444.1 hypothetical protein PYCH_17870 [Pyrococcus yayanosii CH1]